jgi:potassium-transporting ATPase potassium-binding subunit
VAVPLLGRYLAHVYTSPKHLAVERASYRLLRVDPDADQHWRTYAMSVLGFSLVGILFLFTFGRIQEPRAARPQRRTARVAREQVLREVWGPA